VFLFFNRKCNLNLIWYGRRGRAGATKNFSLMFLTLDVLAQRCPTFLFIGQIYGAKNVGGQFSRKLYLIVT
jgi:hypothetical protein